MTERMEPCRNGGRHRWDHIRSPFSWQCRYCGKVVTRNPR